MARSLNRVFLIGNTGGAPELRAVNGGRKVASFSLATSEEWRDAAGVKQTRTEWHRCTAWNRGERGKLAELIAEHVKKGARLHVEGKIRHRQWQDDAGATRYATEIEVIEVTFLDGPRDGVRAGERAAAARAASSSSSSSSAAPAPASDDFEDFPGALEEGDDDLPF